MDWLTVQGLFRSSPLVSTAGLDPTCLSLTLRRNEWITVVLHYYESCSVESWFYSSLCWHHHFMTSSSQPYDVTSVLLLHSERSTLGKTWLFWRWHVYVFMYVRWAALLKTCRLSCRWIDHRLFMCLSDGLVTFPLMSAEIGGSVHCDLHHDIVTWDNEWMRMSSSSQKTTRVMSMV